MDHSWALLGCSWALWGRARLLLGPSWVALGRSCVVFANFLVVLGLSWLLLGRSWPLLGLSWGSLGRTWAALGRSWDSLGPLLGVSCASWVPPGAPWCALGRSKMRQKIDPKTAPKSNRIRIGQNRSGATPVDVSEPRGLTGTQRDPDPASRQNYQSGYTYDEFSSIYLLTRSSSP